MTVGYAVGLGYSPDVGEFYWRTVFAVPIAIAFIRTVLLLLLFRRETPVWYFA
jgi:hypothetical protein